VSAALLFGLFALLALVGAPVAVALAAGGLAGILAGNLGAMAMPTNFWSALAKYPLLAIPMFVLVGSIFDRSGVAERLVRFAAALVGRGAGRLAIIAIVTAMFLGGISGSGPANAAAVGAVMIAAMSRAGYPPAYSASVVGAAAATDILIPPSVAFIVYSILVPGASVPALFAAGMIPGVLAGIALIAPAWWTARRHGFGAAEAKLPRPPFWRSLGDAIWGLAAPVLILGGMRAGWFTPTEAAVVAAVYGLFVGIVVHRTMDWSGVVDTFVEAAQISAVILVVVGLAAVFAWATSTLGIVDPFTRAITGSGLGEYGVMSLIVALLLVLGMVLDGVSIFLICVPLLLPIAQAFRWDPVWFGTVLTLMVAVGQFTPPVAVNLMVSCRIAGVPIESTIRWVWPMVVAMLVATVAVIAWPPLALWLPRALGY
jgi:tripartite ATP-independent transporter DctM subunit